MVWHGRIYSPLPFVRSLRGERINAGVWGTAPFPSVYRTDVHPFAFLPLSVKWQMLSFALVLAGAVAGILQAPVWVAALLAGAGACGIAATFAKNLSYALRSDVDRLPGSKLWYRVTLAYLHFLQPLARFAGQIRGMLSPPEVALPVVRRRTRRGLWLSVHEGARSLLLLSGSVADDQYWSEARTTAERVLTELTDWLRRSRAVRVIEIDEGWTHDRDVSVLVGRWAWLDVRVLAEDHGAGRTLVRIGTSLRPTMAGVVGAVALAAALLGAALTGVTLRWPLAGASTAILTVAVACLAVWRTAQATSILRRGIDEVASESGMVRVGSRAPRVPLASSVARVYGLRSAMVFVVMIVALGAGTFMLREAAIDLVVGSAPRDEGYFGPAIEASLSAPGGLAVTPDGDLYFADSNNHVIRRIDARNRMTTVVGNSAAGAAFAGDYGPATAAGLDTPSDVAFAPDGDLLIADSYNHRIRRVDRDTGIIATIAGSGEAAYNGDHQPAVLAALHWPTAVAAAPNGDVYIADTLNYRIRMVDHATGLIHTIAGIGAPAENGDVGDGGPAAAARLNMPSDVAIGARGDIYIADMHHQRVRKVDAATRIISTMAGSGLWGYSGDGGPAIEAALAGPAGIDVVPDRGSGVTLYIADYYNGRVRVVDARGIIRDISSNGRLTFEAPSRVVFAARRGTLWIADSNGDKLVAYRVREGQPAARLPAGPAVWRQGGQ
jgi:sugar lactone lactonase YvrE